MSNMPPTYPYSMLGYTYPPAYLQLPGYGLPSHHQQQLGLLGTQSLAGLGAQNWAAAGGGVPSHLLAAGQGVQPAYTSSKQGYPVIAPLTAVSAASCPPKLCYGGGGPLTVTAATVMGGGRPAAPAGEPPEPRQHEAVGEGDEYLQELVKERDSIESSSTSSLSKSHILRLLNRGEFTSVLSTGYNCVLCQAQNSCNHTCTFCSCSRSHSGKQTYAPRLCLSTFIEHL